MISENKENTKTEITEIWSQCWTKREIVFCSCEHECKSYYSNFGGKLTRNFWWMADKTTSQNWIIWGHVNNRISKLNSITYFRGVTECTQPVEVVSYKIGVCKVSPSGKECRTEFERLNYNGRTSVVLCRPFTGRMHQIRVHLQYLGK